MEYLLNVHPTTLIFRTGLRCAVALVTDQFATTSVAKVIVFPLGGQVAPRGVAKRTLEVIAARRVRTKFALRFMDKGISVAPFLKFALRIRRIDVIQNAALGRNTTATVRAMLACLAQANAVMRLKAVLRHRGKTILTDSR